MMSLDENSQVDANNIKLSSKFEHHEVVCPTVGTLNVYVQGSRSFNEVAILTVHDLGCDHTMYQDFVEHPKMSAIRDRTVWVHVDVPGQGQDMPDLPSDFAFPRMQQLGEELHHVLDQLRIKEVVCFGEGAGANILARFAMANIERVLGVCLVHCTGTTAGFFESVKDKMINWKHGMNPSAEAYLVLHRFGSSTKPAGDKEEMKAVIEHYQDVLRTRTNPKNLKKFVETFLKRTSITENVGKLKCPVLLVTGSKSLFNRTTKNLHQTIVKTCADKGKVEFIEVQDCANVLEEKPEKLIESFQYFLQGLGCAPSVPMQHVTRPPRMRSMSMEEYDQPRLRGRSMSGGTNSPMSNSPPKSDPSPPQPQPVN